MTNQEHQSAHEPFIKHSEACVIQGPVRDNVEDRAFVDVILTGGGLSLTVAIVADGVGGNVYGEVAAQDAMDQIIAFMTLSQAASTSEIPEMLRDALLHANQYVYAKSRQNREFRGMATTAVVAVIYQKTLYVANVGDSRVYLYDSKTAKLLQLTMDHSWRNDVVRAGHYSVEEARKHPKGESLNRSIGTSAEVEVDIGFYPDQNPKTSPLKTTLDEASWPLSQGDRVIVCSDGLIKGRPQDEATPYVSDAEIVDAILSFPPQAAAQRMLDLTLKRQVDDNVSVIVLETAGSKRLASGRSGQLQQLQWVLLGLLLLLALVSLGLYFFVDGFNTAVNDLFGFGPLPEGTASTGIVSLVTQTPILTTQATQPAVADDSEAAAPTILGDASLQSSEQSQDLDTDQLPNGILISPDDGIATIEDSGTEIVLKLADGQGNVVVESNQNRPVFVENGAGARAGFDGTHPNGLIGVEFDNASNGIFVAHCLIGQCALIGETDERKIVIEAGRSSGITSRGIFDDKDSPARNELFVELSDRVPNPTAVPDPTAVPTNIPTSTPIPRPQRDAGSGPTPVGTIVPLVDPLDLDGDGVIHDPANNLYDLCQDEVGTAGTCGCPVNNVPRACSGSDEQEPAPEPDPLSTTTGEGER